MIGSILFRICAALVGFILGVVAVLTFLHDLGRFGIESLAARIHRHA